MSSRPDLKLDWCSHEAAKYACEKWHYSRQLTPSPHMRVGVWEDARFVGCILFARGASPQLFSPYGLSQIQGTELVRVALVAHFAPVSRILSIAVRILHDACPKLRLIVSFADPAQGHHGGIYQACGWIYTGTTPPTHLYLAPSGKLWHSRVCCERGIKRAFGKLRGVPKPSECKRIDSPGKHRYLMPLDDAMRRQVMPLSRPYPKRAESAVSGMSADQAEGGGATPTSALLPARSS